MGLFDWDTTPQIADVHRIIREIDKELKKPKKPKKLKPGKRSPQDIAAKILEKAKQNERRPETSTLPGPRDPNGLGNHDRRHDQ